MSSNSSSDKKNSEKEFDLQQNSTALRPTASRPTIGNPSFLGHQPFVSIRNHNPNEKMKNWFDHGRIAEEMRRPENTGYKQTSGNELWESDFSDEFISQLMDDTFEERLIQATQEAATSEPIPGSSKTSLAASNKSSSEKIVSSSMGMFQRGGIGKKGLFLNSSNSSRSTSSSSFSDRQRMLVKPSRSFTLPNPSSQSHTTEWLRNQLDKVNKECSSLKETISTKDGESKILREKLNEAKMMIEKEKMNKEIECLNIKTTLEEKIKSLKKELQSAQTQIIFKTKDAESYANRFRELKKMNAVEPQCSQTFSLNQSFKRFINRSEISKMSFETSSQQLMPTQNIKTSLPFRTKQVQHIYVQTETVVPETKKDHSKKITLDFNKEKEVVHLGDQLRFLIFPGISKPAQLEYSHILPPEIDYIPFDILYRDVSEIPFDDYDDSSVNAKLKELWGMSDTNIKKNKPRIPIRQSCHFTSLSAILTDICCLCDLSNWENCPYIDNIIQHVTKMARELFIAFRDPQNHTRKDKKIREEEIYFSCSDPSNLEENFDLFSPDRWKEEINVDLRRGVALIAALCEVSEGVQKMIIKRSHFYKSTKLKGPVSEGFSQEEINDITCVTDTFTYDLVNPSTFLHQRASEFLSNRVTNILKQKQKREKNAKKSSLFENVLGGSSVVKESPVIKDDVTNFSQLISRCLTELKTITKEEKIPTANSSRTLKSNSSEVSMMKTKLNKNFAQYLNSKIDESLVIDSTHTSEGRPHHDAGSDRGSVLDKLIQKKHADWTSDSPLSREISSNLLLKCSSTTEKDMLCSVFKNFLLIKSAMEEEGDTSESDEIEGPDETNDYEPLNKGAEIYHPEVIESRKRKLSPDINEPSTSKDPPKISEKFGKKRDLAPLKKYKKDEVEIEMDTEEIQNELDVIHEQGKQPEENLSAIESDPQQNQCEKFDSEMYEYLFPEEIASQCEILEILLEIVRSIGCLRFSVRFNALLASIVDLMYSLTKSISLLPDDLFGVQFLCTIILEIAYSRPAPVVVLRIHRLLSKCVLIKSFPLIICHNAHPNKCIIKPFKVEIRRGACLLSTLCTVTELYAPDLNWDIQYEFFNWIGGLFLADNHVIIRIFRRQRKTCGQCSCVISLNFCIIKILSEATVTYYSFFLDKKLTALLKSQLEKIMKHGIRILSIILEIDKFFIQNIGYWYDSLVNSLESIKCLHLSDEIDFRLPDDDISNLNSILDEKIPKKSLNRDARERRLKILANSFTSTFKYSSLYTS